MKLGRLKKVFLVISLSAVSYCALAATTNLFRPIIMQAIDAPDGTASRTFSQDEPWVKLMRQKFGTDGPVTVTSKVLKRWKQEGCAQVETSFLFHAVRFDKKTRDLVDDGFSTKLNTCKDGQPPVEAMDFRSINKMLSDTPATEQSVAKQQIVIDKDGHIRSVPVVPAAARSASAAASR